MGMGYLTLKGLATKKQKHKEIKYFMPLYLCGGKY